jgi:hypothetical protein
MPISNEVDMERLSQKLVFKVLRRWGRDGRQLPVKFVIPSEAGIQKKYLYVHQHTMHGKSETIRKMDSRFHGNDEVTLFPSFRTYRATSGHLPPTN